MSKHSVLILGGGFGGVKAALELADDPRFSVSLVSDEDYFRYYPALYHSATGGASRVSAIPIAELLENKSIHFVKARAMSLDREHKTVLTKGAGKLSYDTLIIGLGMTTNYFGIKGLEEFSFGIKSIDEALEFKHHLAKQLADDKRPDAHYLIVGAGPTGVELAGVLPKYIQHLMEKQGIHTKNVKIELIEAAPRILPRLPIDVSRRTAKQLRKLGVIIHTNQKVEAATADSLIINGQPVASKTVVWTAGVACNPFIQNNEFIMTEHHKAQVDQYLQAGKDIYIVGDNADTKYSGVAQTALRDAVFVAKNLKRQADGKSPKVYKPKLPIYVTPTGSGWASVVWGPVHLYGRLGWLMRQAADLIAYHDYQPWWPASERWLAYNFAEED